MPEMTMEIVVEILKSYGLEAHEAHPNHIFVGHNQSYANVLFEGTHLFLNGSYGIKESVSSCGHKFDLCDPNSISKLVDAIRLCFNHAICGSCPNYAFK